MDFLYGNPGIHNFPYNSVLSYVDSHGFLYKYLIPHMDFLYKSIIFSMDFINRVSKNKLFKIKINDRVIKVSINNRSKVITTHKLIYF